MDLKKNSKMKTKRMNITKAFNSKDKVTLKNNKSGIKSIKNKKVQPVILIDYKVLNKNYLKSNVVNSTSNNICKKKNTRTNRMQKVKFSSKSYSVIQIDANNSSDYKPPSSDFLLDIYDYESAILYDKRSFWRLCYICIIAKENIINIIFFKTPLDIQSLRMCLFIFTYSCDLAFNTIFYSTQSISDKYHYQGDNLFLFTIVNNLLQTILSSVVGLILVNAFQHMIDSRGAFEDIFREEEKKMRANKKYKVTENKKLEIMEKIRKISFRW